LDPTGKLQTEINSCRTEEQAGSTTYLALRLQVGHDLTGVEFDVFREKIIMNGLIDASAGLTKFEKIQHGFALQIKTIVSMDDEHRRITFGKARE
jgi:hypothetical protein